MIGDSHLHRYIFHFVAIKHQYTNANFAIKSHQYIIAKLLQQTWFLTSYGSLRIFILVQTSKTVVPLK